jgi:hypothetical protein
MPIDSTLEGFFLGSFLTALIALGIFILISMFLALYIYFAIAWMTIAKKLKNKRPWLAWIPVANMALILQLGNFHWAWIFLILIPFAGWLALFILILIANWRIFEKRKYPGWFSISLLLPQIGWILYLVTIGFVAWKDKKKK